MLSSQATEFSSVLHTRLIKLTNMNNACNNVKIVSCIKIVFVVTCADQVGTLVSLVVENVKSVNSKYFCIPHPAISTFYRICNSNSLIYIENLN
jgi:hypothetical protein